MIKRAIIDNSALRVLYLLNQLPSLHLMYEEVLVPLEVQKEFGSVSDPIENQNRIIFLMRFFQDNDSWFRLCNEYDQGMMTILQTASNIHKGESEVLAQNAYLGAVHEVIIDERIARDFAKQQAYKIRGVLSILARLELQFGCINYQLAVQYVIDNHRSRFSKKIIKEAYQTTKDQLGI